MRDIPFPPRPGYVESAVPIGHGCAIVVQHDAEGHVAEFAIDPGCGEVDQATMDEFQEMLLLSPDGKVEGWFLERWHGGHLCAPRTVTPAVMEA